MINTYIIKRRFTQGQYHRNGHYRIFKIDQTKMYLQDITKDVADKGEFRFNSDKCEIRIQQGGMDGWRQLEIWLRENMCGIEDFIFHID